MSIGNTAVWRIRAAGSNTNGGGYDAGISGAATDYSQQNSAQASGTHGTAAGTTAFTDTVAAAFTAAMIGNALYLTGTGLTTGWYFVTAYTSATAVTLDRSPGTGATGTWHLGGAWADPFTNIVSGGPAVAGNTIYIRGSGSNFPTIADYTNPLGEPGPTPLGGDSTNGWIKYIGENGRPLITSGGEVYTMPGYGSNQYCWMENLCFMPTGTYGEYVGLISNSYSHVFINCLFDQNGYEFILFSGLAKLVGCEFTSRAGGSGGSAYAVTLGTGGGSTMIGCNIHDVTGNGLSTDARLGQQITGNIITRCSGIGVLLAGQENSDGVASLFAFNTIDNNGGTGVSISGTAIPLGFWIFVGNLITNHTASSTYGMSASSGTAASNQLFVGLFDYNWWYGNTTDLLSLSYGPHDSIGVNPGYAAESTQGLTPGSATYNLGYPDVAFLQAIAGITATQNFMIPGAVQLQNLS